MWVFWKTKSNSPLVISFVRKDRRTDRRTDKQTDRQTDGQTDRQTNILNRVVKTSRSAKPLKRLLRGKYLRQFVYIKEKKMQANLFMGLFFFRSLRPHTPTSPHENKNSHM